MQVRDAAVQALNGAAGVAQLTLDVTRSCELFAQVRVRYARHAD